MCVTVCCGDWFRFAPRFHSRLCEWSATKIRWILDNVPEARTAVAAGTALVGNFDAWLVWRLSAGKLFVTGAAARVSAFPDSLHFVDVWQMSPTPAARS
jgi:hypothetical protein